MLKRFISKNKEKLEKDFLAQVSQSQKIIRKICFHYCQTEDEQQDLFQEIMIALWNSYQSYQGKSKFSTWLYRIALNTAITFYRKEKKHYNQVNLENNSSVQHFHEEHTVPLNEDLKILHDVIQMLSKAEKAIILLYLDKKTYEEISEILGITKNLVGVKINRIKSKMKEKLKVLNYE
jgi:RNA polymerase sigma factor (sigma-70 family)